MSAALRDEDTEAAARLQEQAKKLFLDLQVKWDLFSQVKQTTVPFYSQFSLNVIKQVRYEYVPIDVCSLDYENA